VKHDLPEEFASARKQCSQLQVDIDLDFYTKAGIFMDLLVDCSKRMNLVGPGEQSRLWKRHVLESVAFAPFLSRDEFIDIGTGAGFPGFVLSLLGYRGVFVEPRGKRCAFLETAARECGVSCKVVNERIESAGPFPAGTQFTARAVKEPTTLVELISSSVEGPFSLLTRVSDDSTSCLDRPVVTELPTPPLDRGGFLLQYSHSRKQ